MKPITTCPECGADVQATRKIYYRVTEDGDLKEADLGDDWRFYCANDHEIEADTDDYRIA